MLLEQRIVSRHACLKSGWLPYKCCTIGHPSQWETQARFRAVLRGCTDKVLRSILLRGRGQWRGGRQEEGEGTRSDMGAQDSAQAGARRPVRHLNLVISVRVCADVAIS